ncbi:hypothetical protein [Bdellovibrio sp.]|uniref:Ig-like domain-containing protein n=1 Tax=Bdellovibrio sp. TaxID=28201 RepID=UPI0039E4230E
MKILLSIFLVILFCFPNHGAAAPMEISTSSDHLKTQYDKYYYYDFGNVRVNWSEYADIYLKNTGSHPLHLRGVFIQGSAFWAWSNCPTWLSPGQRCLARVEFRPWTNGYFSGRLRFAFPDGNIYVDLYGWGDRW